MSFIVCTRKGVCELGAWESSCALPAWGSECVFLCVRVGPRMWVVSLSVSGCGCSKCASAVIHPWLWVCVCYMIARAHMSLYTWCWDSLLAVAFLRGREMLSHWNQIPDSPPHHLRSISLCKCVHVLRGAYGVQRAYTMSGECVCKYIRARLRVVILCTHVCLYRYVHMCVFYVHMLTGM